MKGNMLINFTPRLTQYCCGLLSAGEGWGGGRFLIQGAIPVAEISRDCIRGSPREKIINCYPGGAGDDSRVGDDFQSPLPPPPPPVPACWERGQIAQRQPSLMPDRLIFPLNQVILPATYIQLQQGTIPTD